MPNLADCVIVVPLPQDQALKVLLLTNVISECKDDPQQLLQAAVLIHDNCLLVRPLHTPSSP